MKRVNELYLGFSDATNYSQRGNKELFNHIFVKNHFLDEILEPSRYFLIGEKGTGKTAYATYLSISNYKENSARNQFISATDYEKFYKLKNQNQLDLTDYEGIWKVIILLIVSKTISEDDSITSKFNKSNVKQLITAIQDYYNNAFSPEITTVMKVMDDSEAVAKIISKVVEIGGGIKNSTEYTETKFQHNLYYIEHNFEENISNLKINKDLTIFIDGIDIRPDSIPYNDYIDCIRGLVHATWYLNTSLFSNIRDSKGHIKIVLLLRPDIFNALNLQNATNKLMDNSVFLDWRTTYATYQNSDLYRIGNQLLTYGQESFEGDIFEEYFPWKLNPSSIDREFDRAFMAFLKISLSRPRDILVIMQNLKKCMTNRSIGESETFSLDVFESDEFQNIYSTYFMSSLKDQLSFYYSHEDYSHFLRFFDFFDKPDFTFDEYKESYDNFIDYILDNANDIPVFVDDPKRLLQLLYESNIIAAKKRDNNNKYYLNFSYREKDSSNVNPQVPIGENISYRFHYGLYKKNNMGRY